ncbi:TIGR03118 family protein [Phenylobacterium sp.]|uniref:TIGR03118 family protein n=1 Tax=Phenylobacterium sp. TaxID=1871053 RepID=UPI0025ECEFA2|nr:TIGR03118 family protein [Phenylobacterium sp.]
MTPIRLAAGASALALLLCAGSAQAGKFVVTKLVTDTPTPGAVTDPSLVNPWGLASAPTGPFWTSDNGTGLATLYNGAGTKLGLTVTIPPGGVAASTPTGVAFNSGSGSAAFAISGRKPIFLFDSEDGVISGWAPTLSLTNAAIAVNNSAAGAVYKGLALSNDGATNRLYAADFHGGNVEVYDDSYTKTGTLTDPTLAAGFAPFNVQVLGGELYVTYARQDAAGHDELAGAGLGYVDVFSLSGAFNRRIASPGGEINAPWGLAIAPGSFGAFAGALLVGNFGDGTISAFNKTSGAFLGKLPGGGGAPLVIDGLWALLPGNGAAGGDADKIYFTAGTDGETHGLFGSLAAAAVPEPQTWALLLAGFGLTGATLRRRRIALAA